MSRIPIRLRLTLAFAAAMALLLAALAVFLYVQLRADLDETIDDNLRSRLGEVSALVVSAPEVGTGAGLSAGEDETFTQVLDSDGSIAFTSPVAGDTPLVDPAELPGSGTLEFERDDVGEGGARLLAARAGDVTVVVGASLDDRDETLASLLTLLLIGGPIALLVASAAGYWVAGSALGPVEAMRRRATEISAGDPGERLPVPPAKDEIGRLGTTLNEMLARLEGALERERRFVDDASHELRTPLALHRAELELALRYGEDSDALRGAIASAIEEVDRLVALAEALLVVARSGEDGLALAIEPVSVDSLFTTILDRFRARAAHAGRALRVGGGGGLAVAGDRMRLEQALTSLVDNALRHGGGEVSLSAESADGRVTIHVSDEGPGFPEGFLPHAFERFTRADPARGRGGAGLGLAIVEAIADAHGGSADAQNANGGADVSIELPASTLPA
jgi:two-component system, OmpR family, sensor kinase